MRKGFTLAEVLITLGIIGVIAAITIPAVIQNTQSQETVVKLKKAYNTLKMVERQAAVERGPISDWQWAGTISDFDFFSPYFDMLKDCGTGTGCFGTDLYELSGTAVATSLDAADAASRKFITSDGLAYIYKPTGKVGPSTGTGGLASRGTFTVDLTGPKTPNKYGKDIFVFDIFPVGGLKPAGAYDDASGVANTSTTIDASCKATADGKLCAAKVLSENALNY